MARVIPFAFQRALAALALATFASFLAALHWLPELLSHFRFQLALASALFFVIAGLLRMMPAALVASLCLIVNLVPMLPFIVPARVDDSGSASSIRLLLLNVQTESRGYHRVRELVRAQQPDIVCLLEVDQRWIAELDSLAETYPHVFRHPRSDHFGFAVFSRVPLDDLETRAFGSASVPALLAHFELGATPTTLLLAHAMPPLGTSRAALRNRQLRAIPALRREFAEREFILAGDLNTTPWSPHYRVLEESGGLTNAAKGFGVHATWPAAALPLRIPIDHVVISEGLRALSYEVGPRTGSDHLPVIVQLVESGIDAQPQHALLGGDDPTY